MAAISQVPSSLDLNLYSGDGLALQLLFVEKSTGLPYPLTGTWAAQIRQFAESEDVLADFTIDDTEAAEGKLYLSLTGEQVSAVLSGGVWDLQQFDEADAGQHRTWYRGKVQVTTDVTRP